MRLLSLMIVYIYLVAGCSSVTSATRKSNESNTVDPQLHKEIAGNGSIKLLEHQLLPIDYLKKHPELKGILINHYMGTGKTYLGIGFAQSYKNHPVLILAPRFLESNWLNSIKSYGADASRFSFVSYEEADKVLATKDVSQYIVLADEVHNLVRKMRSFDAESNARYTQVYTNLRKAHKIIGLTGTPIYADESDIAFLLNFVSGEDLMPFNQETFRLRYTNILKARQYFRGNLTESNLMATMFPTFFGFFTAAVISSPFGMLAGFPVGLGMIIGTNYFFSPPAFKFRELNVDIMAPILNKYVSYFRFADTHFADFPEQDFQINEVAYSKYQYSFFLRLVEGDLPVEQLQRLLQNEHIKRSDEFVKINSSNIHEQIYASVGAGRDIGNFDFKNTEGQIVEAPKFLAILEELNKHDEQTVIYSNYYQTGILAFEKFLQRNGYKKPYAIIEPTLSVNRVNEIVSAYNRGEIRLLMLHPEVTEGISLQGTQFLHILEPMLNSTVLEQVIGRTRRFQSHSHLPKDKQVVKVRMWQSTSSTWNPEISDIERVNWFKRYREIDYFARWGIGISQVDKKMDRKVLNPEELALIKLRALEQNLKEIQTVLTNQSIENNYKK